MEEKNGSCSRHHRQQPSSFLWLLDNNNRPHHSQWLQTTLADLDGKIKKILEVVEDNGDTFAQRAEMYYQKRPQLIQMVGDLHKSYRALADKYDLMLRSESLGCSSTSNSFRQALQQNRYSNSGLIMPPSDDPISDSDHQSFSSDELPKQQKMVDKSEDAWRGDEHYYSDWEKVNERDAAVAGLEKGGWDELLVEVSNLIEENTSKQAELIERYNKKRDYVKQLVNENRRLRDRLAQRKINVIGETPSLNCSSSNSKWKAGLWKLLR